MKNASERRLQAAQRRALGGKTKTQLRVAWVKRWGKRVHIQHHWGCPTTRGLDSDCCCGATEANNQLKVIV